MIEEKEKEYQKEYYLKNKEKKKETYKKYYLENKEKIKLKNEDWQKNNRDKVNAKSRKWKLLNREKYLISHKKSAIKYNYKNKEKILVKSKLYWSEIGKYKYKIYYNENKEKIKKRLKLYRIKNQSKISEQVKIRRRLDYNFRLSHNLRVRLNQILKGKNKSASTMELLGCSIDKLWNHLESKFESWMTKENYGLWHVDHIIACAKFDLTCPEQQRICFHYTNLQPMEAIENMRKGAR